MNNIQRLYYIIPVGLMLVACTEREIEVSDETTSEGDFLIEATINPSAETKTIMDDSDPTNPYQVYWQDKDTVVIGYTGKFNKYGLQSGAGGETAHFKGEKPITVNGTSVYALSYPATDATAAVNGNAIEVGNTLSEVQLYRHNSFEDNTFPVAAASTKASNYDCRNLCGLIQIPLKGTGTIVQITLTSNGGEQMTGPVSMKFDKTTGEPVSSSLEEDNKYELVRPGSGEGSSMVILNCGQQGITLDETTATEFNFVVLPQVYSQGFTAIFISDNGDRFTRTISSKVVVKRSWAVRMMEDSYDKGAPLETANCFIVPESGYYMFPAYGMGNRQDGEALFTDKYGIDNTGTTNDGSKVKAALLWTDVLTEHPVDRIRYIPADNGRGNIYFRLKKDSDGNPYRGNAVVALYKESKSGVKTIIWSWHLWLTEEPKTVIVGGSCDGRIVYTGKDPKTGEAYKFESYSANGKMEVMDRNLGAISAKPTDGWKTYGVHYQMGRKDPFPGADYSLGNIGNCGYYNSKEKKYKDYEGSVDDSKKIYTSEDTPFSKSNKSNLGTIETWVNTELAPNGFEVFDTPINLSYSFAHPLVFSADINKTGSHKLVWTDCMSADNLYYAPDYKSDSTSVSPITGMRKGGHEAYWNRTKTAEDPCPAGWTILGKADEGTQSMLGKEDVIKKGGATFTLDSTNKGYTFEYEGTTSWWPFSGCRTYDGKIGMVGQTGFYMDFDHIDADHGWHGEYYNATKSTKPMKAEIIGNIAGSVRCVRAKQTYGTAPTSSNNKK